MYVRNHMDEHVPTIAMNRTVAEALLEMRRQQCVALAVVTQADRFRGMVTEPLLYDRLADNGSAAMTWQIGKLATAQGPLMDPGDPMEDAINAFCFDDRIAAMPVLRGDVLCGILWRHKVMRSLAAMVGMSRAGIFVEVAVSDGIDDLSSALEILCGAGIVPHSLIYGCTRDDGAEPVLRLRIDEADRPAIEHAFNEAGFVLLVPEIESARLAQRGTRAPKQHNRGATAFDGYTLPDGPTLRFVAEPSHADIIEAWPVARQYRAL